MKYLLLIYGNPTNWIHPIHLHQAGHDSPEERSAMTASFDALLQEISERGELVAAAPLAAPESTRTVRIQHGAPAVTDGPFAEVKEQLAGYFILDCESVERAVEIASRFPDARFGPIEVRPIMDSAGQEM